MDIDLLAKMVHEVMMDHDSVTLPGLGSFAAELVPATFSDKGYTINPPYRRLYFIPRQGSDTLLADLYASSNNISVQDATRILVEFLSEMKEVLIAKKIIIFPGLGRLRATRENHFFFVADEYLDIYPAGFGLEPISLKTHEETPQEVEAAVSSLAQMLEPEPVVEEIPGTSPGMTATEPEPAPVPVAEPEPTPEPEPEPVPVAEPEPEPTPVILSKAEESKPEPVQEPVVEEIPGTSPRMTTTAPEASAKKKMPVIWTVLIWIVAILAVAVLALAVIGRVAPDWLDYYLYSPEELEILRSL